MSLVLGILIKYILLGTSVAIAASILPKTKVPSNDIFKLSLTAAVIFLMLDIYAPSVGLGARQGAGFGIGSQLVGGLGPIEGMENVNGEYESSGRNEKLHKLHRETVSRELNRLKYTGGSMHSEPRLDADYHSYGIMGPEEEANNGLLSNAGNAAQQISNAHNSDYIFSETNIEPFSENFKESRMKRLNLMGRVNARHSAELYN